MFPRVPGGLVPADLVCLRRRAAGESAEGGRVIESDFEAEREVFF